MKASNESYFFDVSERFLRMSGFERACRLLMYALLNIVFYEFDKFVLEL